MIEIIKLYFIINIKGQAYDIESECRNALAFLCTVAQKMSCFWYIVKCVIIAFFRELWYNITVKIGQSLIKKKGGCNDENLVVR